MPLVQVRFAIPSLQGPRGCKSLIVSRMIVSAQQAARRQAGLWSRYSFDVFFCVISATTPNDGRGLRDLATPAPRTVAGPAVARSCICANDTVMVGCCGGCDCCAVEQAVADVVGGGG